MHKTGIVLVALACGILTASHAQMSQNTKNNQSTNKKNESMGNNFNEEQRKVFSTIERMVAAFEKKDIDGVLATYETDAIVMFEPQKPVQGKETLRSFFTQFVGMNPKYTFTGHEVYVSGNIATHTAPWSMEGQLPDGTKVEQSGLSVAVLRKQADGSWLMIQDNPHGQFLLTK